MKTEYVAGRVFDRWHDESRAVHALRADDMSPACGCKTHGTTGQYPGATLEDVDCGRCMRIAGPPPARDGEVRIPAQVVRIRGAVGAIGLTPTAVGSGGPPWEPRNSRWLPKVGARCAFVLRDGAAWIVA